MVARGVRRGGTMMDRDEDLVPLSTACAVLDPQFAAVQYHHHHALTAHHGRAVRHEATIDT